MATSAATAAVAATTSADAARKQLLSLEVGAKWAQTLARLNSGSAIGALKEAMNAELALRGPDAVTANFKECAP